MEIQFLKQYKKVVFFKQLLLRFYYIAAQDGPLPQNKKEDWMGPTKGAKSDYECYLQGSSDQRAIVQY